jgi:Putative zinc-finger
MNETSRDSDSEIDAQVRAAAAAGRAEQPDHSEPDELVDYTLGRLDPAAKARLEEHLAVCAECTRALLDLEELAKPPPGREEPSAEEMAQAWEQIVARLGWRPAVGGARRPAPRAIDLALAASVLLCLGLVAWNLTLRRDLELASQPGTNLQLVELAPIESGRERGEHAPEVVIRPRVARVVLRLNLGDLRDFPRYTLSLQGPAGRPLWRDFDARRGEDGAFLVEVAPRTLAEPGLYRLHLEGRRGDEAVRLADYAWRVP